MIEQIYNKNLTLKNLFSLFSKKKLPISEQLSPVANLDFSKYLNVPVFLFLLLR
jgi:hypothetical protein